MGSENVDVKEALNPDKFSLSVTIKSDEKKISEEAQRNRAVTIAAYHATVAGNESALAELLHPEVVFREAAGLPYGLEAKGIEATLKGVMEMFGPWKSVDAEIFEICAAGDYVINLINLKNVARDTGKPYVGPTAEVFRFKDGKIIEWYPIYWDTHAVRVACGVS